MITVREIAGPEELEICRALRREVFIEEQAVPEAEEWDGLDAEARHWLVFDGETPVATMRLRQLGETGKIERVCVLAAHRGAGHGAVLMRTAIDALGAMPGVTEAKLGAQLHAIRFYEALGFEAFGPEFMDGGMPHRHMRRAIP